MSGHGFHVHGPHDHALEHAATASTALASNSVSPDIDALTQRVSRFSIDTPRRASASAISRTMPGRS